MKTLFSVLLFVCISILTQAQPANSLTAQEKKEGWQLLFDGKTLKNWHNYDRKNIGPAWRVADGAMNLYAPTRAGNKTQGGGDLVTNELFTGDFEFKVDWKVNRLSNSGIFFFVTETPEYKEIYHTGLELQVLDNAIYAEAKDDNKKRAGDLFGVVSTGIMEVKPVGEWNQIHVIHQKGNLKIFMNGFQIHDIGLNSPEWKTNLAKTFLKDAPVGKGKYEGRIGLQDWGSTVWYRNIKIRLLPKS